MIGVVASCSSCAMLQGMLWMRLQQLQLLHLLLLLGLKAARHLNELLWHHLLHCCLLLRWLLHQHQCLHDGHLLLLLLLGRLLGSVARHALGC